MNELSLQKQKLRIALLETVRAGVRKGLSERAALLAIHEKQSLCPSVDMTGFALYEDFNMFYDCYKKYKRDDERSKKDNSKFPKIPHTLNNATQGMARL